MFKNNFSKKGRIGRTEYVFSFIISQGAIFLISYSLGYLGLTDGATYGLEILYIAITTITIWFLLQGAKRCHDRGNSGLYQLIPFYIFWMLFGVGENKENEYGSNLKE